MKEAVLQRVIEVMRYKSTSEREFANLIGANQKTINQQIKQERSLSFDTILSIISSFEDISAEWLLRGTGEMLIGENKPQLTKTVKHYAEIEIDEDGNLKIKIKK